MPYWLANGIGFSLEHGYRLLRRTTRLSTPPLLSAPGRAGPRARPGLQQPQGPRGAGWVPRIDYVTGLEATLAWLQSEHLAR